MDLLNSSKGDKLFCFVDNILKIVLLLLIIFLGRLLFGFL